MQEPFLIIKWQDFSSVEKNPKAYFRRKK